ncbi:hypothetical protein Tco_1081848 [Tanacetum coccineum]|uniref:Uncharacterized protein n=1 Tax=Tanacetum coccineum TaxID=301880 RepID=A0ABQ5HYV3_9ASTR
MGLLALWMPKPDDRESRRSAMGLGILRSGSMMTRIIICYDKGIPWHRQTRIFQSVEALVDDRQYHYETARLLDQEALVSREAWAHLVGLSSAVHYELQGYRTHTWMQDHRIDAQESLIATLVHETRSQMQQTEMAELRETDCRQQRRRARQPAPDARVPDHQDAFGDDDSHI